MMLTLGISRVYIIETKKKILMLPVGNQSKYEGMYVNEIHTDHN